MGGRGSRYQNLRGKKRSQWNKVGIRKFQRVIEKFSLNPEKSPNKLTSSARGDFFLIITNVSEKFIVIVFVVMYI